MGKMEHSAVHWVTAFCAENIVSYVTMLADWHHPSRPATSAIYKIDTRLAL